MNGRRCSGRPRSFDEQAKKRFVEMVKASCDSSSQGFIFITQKARTIKNYHHWLEQELNRSISLGALRRCVKRENLKSYLNKIEGDYGVGKTRFLKLLRPKKLHAVRVESLFNIHETLASILKELNYDTTATKALHYLHLIIGLCMINSTRGKLFFAIITSSP